jgi:hypothetical protein
MNGWLFNILRYHDNSGITTAEPVRHPCRRL